MRQNITILGDSRVFDTYFTSSQYAVRYGYHKTFPHLWRKKALQDADAGYDVIHITDHFRGGTLQNNIIRLALTDPAIIVIVDGIWETLLNRGHYNEYLERHSSSDSEPKYAPQRLVELFKANKLSVSPLAFAHQQARLVSYFRRRRRQVIWVTLPVPPKSYIGSTFHAGDYTPIPDWDECLAAVNDAVVPMIKAYGGEVLDMTALMEELGGVEKALIDQWHFSEAFHELITVKLDQLTRTLLPEVPGADHISGNYMLGAPSSDAPPDEVVMFEGDTADEVSAMQALSGDQILLYPSELGEIDNPRGDDRAEFERQSDR